MSHAPFKVLATKTGALCATGLVASSIFASMPAADAVDTGSFGSVISASEAQSTTREVPVDNTALLAAVEEARAAGLTITEEQTKTITTGTTTEVQAVLDTITTEYQAKIAELTTKTTQYKKDVAAAKAAYETEKEATDKHNAELKADYEAKLATYQQAKAEYDKAKATYDELVAAQITDADPTVALTPETLAYAQTISINENRNSLVAIDGATITREFTADNPTNTDYIYNSDVVKVVSAHDGMNFSATWDKAVTTSDGRQLDAKLTFSNIITASTDGLAGTNRPAEIAVYSNYSDSIAMWLVAGGTVTVQYFDDATGAEYDKDFYQTAGSLNNQGLRAEFASPIIDPEAKIKATFLNQGSWVSKSVEPVYGKASQITDTGFRLVAGQPHGISDESDEALSLLGVTFLGSSGMSFNVGTSGVTEGTDPLPDENYWAWYNHLMLSANTVAPTASEPVAPVEPKEPEYAPAPVYDAPEVPSVSYQLTKLSAPIPVVDKVAADEGKKVIAGETTTQTVSYATGYKAPESFILGDHIYFTEDGRMPVSVDMSQVKVTDETGADVTELFTITAEDGVHNGKAGHQILATAKNPAGLQLNHVYTLHVNQTSLFDGVADTLMDAGFAIVNDELQYTTDKTYHEPAITPSKVDTSATDGSNIDGKTVTVGDTISYKLVEDTTDLVDTTSPVKVSGMVDDFDERYGDIDASAVRVYQVPGDTDTSTPEAVSAAVKLATAKDVTDSYTVTNGEVEGLTNGGAVGISSMMKTEGEGEEQKVVLPMGFKYIHVLPYTVTANTDGDILNTAWQVTNGARTQTETVANKLKEINPTKDVVINVGDKDSIDGAEIALNTVFNYQLNSSTLPAERAGHSESWSITDDYDETKDAYEGNFLVQNTRNFVDADGKTVSAGSDITEYFTQVHRDGKVTYEATEAFLKLMSSEANRGTEQGFTVFMQVQRIGVGEVLNTFVENYNGEKLVSNTVKTFTPEPSVPPVVPEDPASVPPVPVTPEPAAPVIKGEGAKTGGEARVAGVPVAGLLTAGGVLLAGLVGAGAWALVAGARKKNS
ncbi:LPXTG cell wall anchor domain-containing protein [Rothia nasimurium]|uniref:LPXTG cell wall anchor domain-containing protein n=1 Tax=Rothia nasimurium TaxID=85336 RepID=UPI002DD63D17|nr:LPXTG cell wall anchor domain-containing protein [Rothia nasimurium]